MRQIYSSPRPENIDRVVALMAEHGIETSVSNRSVYNRPSYSRYSYSERGASRHQWPAVQIERAEDLTPARQLLREIGIEPTTAHSELLAEARQMQGVQKNGRNPVASRIRMLALIAVAGTLLVMVMRAMHLF